MAISRSARLLRGRDRDTRWQGCQAGPTSLGIEADGTAKGCPSLPTADYTGGNVRNRRLADIVTTAPQLTFDLGAPQDALWGFCRTCEHATTCRGGCSWTAHTLFGRRGNNPYCHHRTLELDRTGHRERLIPIEAPIGVSPIRGATGRRPRPQLAAASTLHTFLERERARGAA